MSTTCSSCARRARARAQVTSTPSAESVSVAPRLEERTPEEEPMRRYIHPIPTCSCGQPITDNGSAALTQVMERLSVQDQILVDLVEAVNGLTGALSNRCGEG